MHVKLHFFPQDLNNKKNILIRVGDVRMKNLNILFKLYHSFKCFSYFTIKYSTITPYSADNVKSTPHTRRCQHIASYGMEASKYSRTMSCGGICSIIYVELQWNVVCFAQVLHVRKVVFAGSCYSIVHLIQLFAYVFSVRTHLCPGGKFSNLPEFITGAVLAQY